MRQPFWAPPCSRTNSSSVRRSFSKRISPEMRLRRLDDREQVELLRARPRRWRWARAAAARGAADSAARAASPCRRPPSARSRSGPRAGTYRRSARTLALGRTETRARRRALRRGRSRCRAPSGWPLHRGAWRRGPGPRCGRPRRTPGRSGSGSSRGSLSAQRFSFCSCFSSVCANCSPLLGRRLRVERRQP